MNIYEQPELEKKLEKLTDQIGHILLDMLLVSLKKINHENVIFTEFEEARLHTESDNTPF